jgi:choline dehydrogenase-like flavoprotein
LIIVGAGTAGCVLAEQLSKSGKLQVLLIEAGGPPASRFVSIPAGFSKLFKSHFDWAFDSEPQIAVGGRRIFTPRGKMLGGSSNINARSINGVILLTSTAGWRVAEASVMPSVPRGHPNAVVAMIAERAAGSIEALMVP